MVVLRRSIGLSQNLLVDLNISFIVVILACVVVRLLMTEFSPPVSRLVGKCCEGGFE